MQTETIEIPINATGNAANQIQGLVGKMSGLERAALNPNSNFSRGLEQLNKGFSSGAISAAQYERGLRRLGWQSMDFGEKAQVVRNHLNNMQATMLKFGVAAASVGVAGKQVYNLARAGAELQFTQTRFDRLSTSMGTTSEIMMNRLRQATRGTVSDMQLARQGADLFQLGLARTADEAVRLSRIQTALGMDTGELTLALANQSKRRLDQLGLSLTAFNKIEREMKALGLSKEDAFREAFMLTAEQTIATTGNRADSDFGSFLRLEASAANFFDDYKVRLGQQLAPTAEGVGMFFTGLRELMSGDRRLDLFGGDGDWVRQGSWRDFAADRFNAMQNRRISGTAANIPSWDARAIQMNRGIAMTEFFNAQLAAQGGAPGVVNLPDLTDYENLLKGGLQLTDATEKISQATMELNAQLAAETRALQELQQAGYGPTNEKVMEHQQNIRALREEINATSAASVDATNNLMMANIAAAASEDEKAQKQLEYARATGQISEEAYKQQSALMGIADAFAAGTITADQAAAAAQNVIKMLEMLDGMEVNAIVNLAIAGVMPAFTGVGATSGGGQVVKPRPGSNQGGIISLSEGGPLGPVTVVGDAPGGAWTPYTEVIVGNQVIPNRQARKLRDLGVLGGARSAASGILLDGAYSPTSLSQILGGSSVRVRSSTSAVGGGKNTGAGTGFGALASPSMSAAPIIAAPIIADAVAGEVAPSVTQAVVAAVIAQIQQMQAAQQMTFVNTINDKMDEVISVLRSDNPRAVGEFVGGQMARRT